MRLPLGGCATMGGLMDGRSERHWWCLGLLACAGAAAACQSEGSGPLYYEAPSLWAQSLDYGYINALARPVVKGAQTRHAKDAVIHKALS
jgi:hypothetical protein